MTLIRREGLRAVRVTEFAEEARCSRSTLYELAPSKEERFLLVLARLISRICLSGYAAHAGVEDPIEQLKAAMSGGALGTNLRLLVDRAIETGAFRPVDAAVGCAAR